ncbi:MAG: hypothetical protein V4642_13240 [Bacteroidota bacterium]
MGNIFLKVDRDAVWIAFKNISASGNVPAMKCETSLLKPRIFKE